MSLTAQDIVALARAGYNAEQISFLNKEVLSSPSTDLSTESTPSTDLSTESTPSTVSTEPAQKQELSTPSTEPATQPVSPPPAAPAPDQPAAPRDPGPTVQDLMAKLASLESKLVGQAINLDQQPGQEERLTGEAVLAQILDPRL